MLFCVDAASGQYGPINEVSTTVSRSFGVPVRAPKRADASVFEAVSTTKTHTNIVTKAKNQISNPKANHHRPGIFAFHAVCPPRTVLFFKP